VEGLNAVKYLYNYFPRYKIIRQCYADIFLVDFLLPYSCTVAAAITSLTAIQAIMEGDGRQQLNICQKV